MALTVTSVTPPTGLTGGREFVLIQGTDFNISVDVDGHSRMEVYFGTELATRVRVRSATELDCLTPIHDPGSYDVKVKDLDAVVEDVLVDGFDFGRPVIGDQAVKSDIVYVIDTLVTEMKRQIIEEIIVGTSVDYDPDTDEGFHIVGLSKVPAIVLDGPRIYSSGGPFHRTGEQIEEVSPGIGRKIIAQDICNFEFTLSGVDDHKIRLLNLLREVISFFRRNEILRIRRDPLDPNSILEEIEMHPPMPEQWRVLSSGNKSSLKIFSGVFTLFGIPVGHGTTWNEVWEITDTDSGISVLPM